jgi:hypothetical protein
MQSCMYEQGHSEQLSCAKLGIVVDGACEFRYWKDIQIPNNTYNTRRTKDKLSIEPVFQSNISRRMRTAAQDVSL